MRWPKDTAIALALTVALITSGTIAFAGSVAVSDPTGDAPRAIDVTRLRVENARHAVTIHIRFADLNRARVRLIRSELDVGKQLGWGYVIVFKRRRSGGFAKQLSWVRLYAEGGTTLPRCAGLRLVWADNRADIQLPRACMSKPHDERVRSNVTITSLTKKRDFIPDNLLSFTPWVPRG